MSGRWQCVKTPQNSWQWTTAVTSARTWRHRQQQLPRSSTFELERMRAPVCEWTQRNKPAASTSTSATALSLPERRVVNLERQDHCSMTRNQMCLLLFTQKFDSDGFGLPGSSFPWKSFALIRPIRFQQLGQHHMASDGDRQYIGRWPQVWSGAGPGSRQTQRSRPSQFRLRCPGLVTFAAALRSAIRRYAKKCRSVRAVPKPDGP